MELEVTTTGDVFLPSGGLRCVLANTACELSWWMLSPRKACGCARCCCLLLLLLLLSGQYGALKS